MRSTTQLSESVSVTRGHDHALGNFVQVNDSRFANTQDDIQGEGFVLDWDEVMGFTTNHIEATLDDLKSDQKLLELANNIEWV